MKREISDEESLVCLKMENSALRQLKDDLESQLAAANAKMEAALEWISHYETPLYDALDPLKKILERAELTREEMEKISEPANFELPKEKTQ